MNWYVEQHKKYNMIIVVIKSFKHDWVQKKKLLKKGLIFITQVNIKHFNS